MQQKAFILFGPTGSLSKIKIFPALNNLYKNEEIEKDMPIIAYGRKPFDPVDFRKYLSSEIPDLDTEFLESVTYIEGDLEDGNNLLQFVRINNLSNLYFYFSLPPNLYIPTIDFVYKTFKDLDIKIALEKPFGTSFFEAQKIVEKIGQREKDFYLVDHYLAKEAVINFPQKIDLSNVSKIDISILETETVLGREVFYDHTGAGIDTVQNHILNMLDRLMGKKILSKLEYVKRSLVLGQYDGYLKSDLVPNSSKTETYFKADFLYENDTGNSIKIIVRSGKALNQTKTLVNIKFMNNEIQSILIKPNPAETKFPHEYVINDFISDKIRFAVTINEALMSWVCMNRVLKDKTKTKIKTYKQHSNYEDIESAITL